MKLDDRFPEHPKVSKLAANVRPLAVFLHICGLCWCNSHLTDGRIPKTFLTRLGAGMDAETIAAHLVSVGLWEEDETDYIIHDFHDFQPSRYEVEARRKHITKARKSAGSKGGSKTASKRAANAQQPDQQKSSPDPDPLGTDQDLKPPPPPLARGGDQQASSEEPDEEALAAELWEAYSEAAARREVFLPLQASGTDFYALRGLVRAHPLDDLKAATRRYWQTKEKRHAVRFFVERAPELVAQVRKAREDEYIPEWVTWHCKCGQIHHARYGSAEVNTCLRIEPCKPPNFSEFVASLKEEAKKWA